MRYTIRQYHPDDFDQVIHLMRMNTPKYFDPGEEEDLVSYLKTLPETYFVCEIDQKIIGAGGHHLEEDKSLGVLSWYFIHPDYQGIGLGSAIVGKNIEELKRNEKLKKVMVRTSQFANSFFARHGFRLVSSEKDYWAPGFDLYLMEMEA